MKITAAKSKIRCEAIGCNTLADVFIYKNDKCYNGDAIKLCNSCAKELLNCLKKHYAKKGKTDGEKQTN